MVVYALVLAAGNRLLHDPDTYWHLAVGRWLLDHLAFPHADPFSWTYEGRPWIAMEWLAQVTFRVIFERGGWTALVLVSAAAIALTFVLLCRALTRTLEVPVALLLLVSAFFLAAPHFLVRPHVLSLPLMVAWVAALVRSADERRGPPWRALPLVALWANLHGGYTLGLALVLPVALESVLSTPPVERRSAAVTWAGFTAAAVVFGCLTPYGPESLLSTPRVLDLGPAFLLIGEWRPQDFSSPTLFEVLLLGSLGYALLRGLSLPPIRLLVVLGLLHLGLSHVRSAEELGLLAPLFVAQPLRSQTALAGRPLAGTEAAPWMAIASAILVLGVLTASYAGLAGPTPPGRTTPTAAVEEIRRSRLDHVLNDYDFGGYLVFSGVPPFIDGRTELYGKDFIIRHDAALSLHDLADFRGLLDEFEVRATLLAPGTPAVALLDMLPGWRRAYADDRAVIHVRTTTSP